MSSGNDGGRITNGKTNLRTTNSPKWQSLFSEFGRKVLGAVQDAKENKETEKEISKEKTAHDQTAVPLDGMTKVHIESPVAVSLEKRQGDNGAWQHVCTASWA